MRTKTVYGILVLLCPFLLASTAYAQLRKIYLQPKTIAREKQSTYVDSMRFIPLEIKAGIELGAYYNTYITEKYLLLNDYLNKRLILYTREGRFVKNIRYNKLNGDFYPTYQEHTNQVVFFGNNKNYALTPKDQIQIKLDWENPRNRKYFKKYILDLNDSTLAIKKEVPAEKDIIGVSHYYDDYYLQGQIITSPLYRDSLDQELKLYRNNQLVKTFFPYNRINEPRYIYTTESIAFSKTDTPYIQLVARPFCDTIFKLVKDSLFATCQLVLPMENSLPTSYFITPFKNKTDRENFDRNNGWMFHQVYGFQETPRLIYFMVAYLSNDDSYVYDKQKDMVYKAGNIKADTSQYNINLLQNYLGEHKGDRFYKPLRASDVLPFFEKNKDVPVPKELVAFLKSKPPGTTPLIVEYKLKN